MDEHDTHIKAQDRDAYIQYVGIATALVATFDTFAAGRRLRCYAAAVREGTSCEFIVRFRNNKASFLNENKRNKQLSHILYGQENFLL